MNTTENNSTGSLVNYLQGGPTKETPKVGMGATVLMWTDRTPATIIEVSPSGKTLKAQEDDAKRVDSNGMSDAQQYEYTPNPEGYTTTFTLRKNGSWVRQGESMNTGQRLRIGSREKYYDFSF